MKPIARHPAVGTDISESHDGYNSLQDGVGNRFLDAVKTVYTSIQQNPTHWAFRTTSVRKCPLKKFPFNVIFTERTDTIWIIAVAHTSRCPNYWSKRLKDIP